MRALVWLVRHLPGRDLPLTPTDVAYAKPWPTTRRGLKLWGLALIFVVRGVTYVLSPSPSLREALAALEWVPIPILGSLLITTSLYALWMSYCHHGRDRYGYMALAALAGLFGSSYLGSLLFLGAPGYAWGGVTSWGITVWLVIVMAGDPDPAHERGRRCDP